MHIRQIDERLAIPARLAIVTALADGCWHTFSDLRQETGLADGNLHVQCRKLVDADYLEAEKQKHGNRRVTCFRLTKVGRQRLLAHIRALNEAVKSGTRPGPGRSGTAPKDDAMVW